MALKMRLQRYGKKNKPFYHIVVVDGRAPRDGKFIEQLGNYNPMTNPATIELNFDNALDWLNKGAQPTDTVRSILSYKGVLYKNHLLKGIKKGALTQEQAETKFANWLKEKDMKINSKINKVELDKKTKEKEIFNSEVKKKEAKAAEVAKKLAVENANESVAAESQDENNINATTETEIVVDNEQN